MEFIEAESNSNDLLEDYTTSFENHDDQIEEEF